MKNTHSQPQIKDLAVIGDRNTCAIVDKNGSMVWYCPLRYDTPSVFSLLIDTEGGGWFIDFAGKQFIKRSYTENSAILNTTFAASGGEVVVTDYMPIGGYFSGICRKFLPSQNNVVNTIQLKPEYGTTEAKIKTIDKNSLHFIKANLFLKVSHPISIINNSVVFTIPEGEEGWAVLCNNNDEFDYMDDAMIDKSLADTQKEWGKITGNFTYKGPYEKEMHASFLAIKLLTYANNGGIIAAATTSLPEIIGGYRNYDYRYVWLRDTAMIVSALTRAEVEGNEEQLFLDFICGARSTAHTKHFIPFYDLDFNIAPDIEELPLQGYKGSLPVQIGNGANKQLQLDANGNVLIAAKLIYSKISGKPHWDTVAYIADYLVDNWHKPDHGIWEEDLKKHFTSSKVIVAKSLEFIADFATSTLQAKKWRDTSKKIRDFITENCMTKDGAYAVYAGSNEVDITAALFPVWLYDEPDSAAMLQTIKRIEDEYSAGDLYHRRLELFPSKEEGVFLASCFWMAQYYIMCNHLDKAKTIIDAALKFSTDLFFFAEEGDVPTGDMLGNFPQTFVHASFIGTVLDYKNALLKKA